MLAMVVNEDAGCLDARGAWASIASMLAPTGSGASMPVGRPRLAHHALLSDTGHFAPTATLDQQTG